MNLSLNFLSNKEDSTTSIVFCFVLFLFLFFFFIPLLFHFVKKRPAESFSKDSAVD